MSKSSEKNVAIVGAGVSGLVTAVNMHKVGIRPIVFEKASNIGGMWNADIKPCWRTMRTNISKFSTVLSDFPWPKDASIFPSQREVYDYLTNYVKQSLPEEIFRFNVQVINVTLCDNKWTVEYRTELDCTHFEQYDFLIVASGFFDCPHIPKNIIDLSSFHGTLMHSSNYYSPEQVKNQRVIIVGASLSAAEIAADMSVSAKQIIHIVPHSFWSIPRFIPLIPNDPVSSFLPIDLVLYRQSKRLSNHEISIRNSDDNKRLNNFMQLITGNSQQASSLNDSNEEKPPFIAISDRYAEWHRSGKIILKHGRLHAIGRDGTLTLNNGTTIKTNSDDILTLCTGYQPNFNFFSKDILEQLSYIPDDIFCPIILHRSIFHPKLPNLAFIGMYRGPFWSVIELQARWVAAIFSGAVSTPSVAVQEIGLDMERRIRDQQPRPQFPHGDYVGIVNDLANEVLGVTPSDISDIVIPAQYRSDGPDRTVIDEMNSLCNEANHGRFIAGAVFRALHQSKWTFQRTLTGKPSDGVVHGQAQFNYSQTQELLYREEGKLILASQVPLDISQKYIYAYDEDKDILSVYFVDNGNARGSLFHRITFQSKEASEIGWLANGEHLCSQDKYSISYVFVFNGINLSRFEITYVVKGPVKDYTSKTVFLPANVE